MKGGHKDFLKIFKENMRIGARNQGGDEEEHEIKYGE